MAFYTLSMKQVIVNSLLIALVSSSTIILFMVGKEYYLEWPDVYKNVEGKCVKVINFKNGDAYNCNDLDVVLRNYKVKKVDGITAEKPTEK
jgi:hypothetical protein